MKKLWFSLLLLVSLLSCELIKDDYVVSIEKERQDKDSLFLIESESPLSLDQIKEFEGLHYFPVDKSYRLEARLELIHSDSIVKMKTSTDRLPDYKIYGYVYFQLEEKEHRLTAFQNLAHQTDTLYANLLFLPFTDNNSTVLTYGGGRYIDFEIPKEDTFILDFNRAYNPYCAYNHRWSCVIPPRENALNIAINAGEKNYEEHF